MGLSGDDGFLTDTVDLGEGSDQLSLETRPASSAGFDGGPGTDELFLMGDFAWTIDAAANVLSGGPGGAASLAGFGRFGASKVHSLAFTGTSNPERLRMYGDFPYAASMGAGDDWVRVTVHAGRVIGGPGNDEVLLDARGSGVRKAATFDLARNLLVLDDGASRTRAHVDAENATVEGIRQATMIGDAGPNRLTTVNTCTTTLRGAAGNDHLAILANYCRGTNQAFGGAGNDDLIGGVHRDLLDGGSGSDHADGGSGRDTCRAETRVHCETR